MILLLEWVFKCNLCMLQNCDIIYYLNLDVNYWIFNVIFIIDFFQIVSCWLNDLFHTIFVLWKKIILLISFSYGFSLKWSQNWENWRSYELKMYTRLRIIFTHSYNKSDTYFDVESTFNFLSLEWRNVFIYKFYMYITGIYVVFFQLFKLNESN